MNRVAIQADIDGSRERGNCVYGGLGREYLESNCESTVGVGLFVWKIWVVRPGRLGCSRCVCSIHYSLRKSDKFDTPSYWDSQRDTFD